MTNKKMIPVLAGGGTRLPAHVGILTALEHMEYGIDRLVGVSGGSIVASLFAYGYPTEYLKNLAFDVDFRQFRGFSLQKLLFNGGLSTGERFEQWLDDQLGGATFAALERELHVVATDVRSGEPVIFDREHSPDFRVARAVRFSMGIPLLFTFERYKKHLMVDGSILAEDALYRQWTTDDTPVVYFRLRSTREASAVKESNIFPLPDYLTMLIRTFMTSISREYIATPYWRNTVVVETGESSPLEFAMSPTQKQDLFQRGYDTACSVIPLKLERDSDTTATTLVAGTGDAAATG
ncbi:MAG: patatin-like phospholipase family protein [Gammaproteobacteria bacterium]|nr:patatin-like phospholipase family protein [Gammaproteobacteria bacterium]MCB1924301.1 patatin-like phospholipase family protein [Gammaproteobacteria bacterium]